MARQVNGHLGTFATIAELTAKFAPSGSIGCSANIGTTIPYTKAWCDGQAWALVQAPQLQALVSGAGISGATYDGSGRLTGYVRQGVQHTISYPSSTTVVVSNTLGAEREVTLDGSGRVQAIA